MKWWSAGITDVLVNVPYVIFRRIQTKKKKIIILERFVWWCFIKSVVFVTKGISKNFKFLFFKKNLEDATPLKIQKWLNCKFLIYLFQFISYLDGILLRPPKSKSKVLKFNMVVFGYEEVFFWKTTFCTFLWAKGKDIDFVIWDFLLFCKIKLWDKHNILVALFFFHYYY